MKKNRDMNDSQTMDVNRKRVNTRRTTVSHANADADCTTASHYRADVQETRASRTKGDNQTGTASHCRNDTQFVIANQPNGDVHVSPVNPGSADAHINFVRTPEQEGLLRQVRLYQFFVRLKVGLENQIGSAVRREMMSADDAKALSETSVKPWRQQADAIIKVAAKQVKDYPIYREWLHAIRGIGPTLAVQYIAMLSPISRFPNVAKLWAYAGLSCDKDGQALRRKRGQKSNWNAALKTLAYNTADCFVKAGGFYRTIYDRYKARDRAKHPEKIKLPTKPGDEPRFLYSDGHIHARAMRYTSKMFLSNLWEAWRSLEGLPVRQPYPIEYLGHDTHITPWEARDHDIALKAKPEPELAVA